MFFQTNPALLRPLHSLLKKPFDFAAASSISGTLNRHLSHRSDFSRLVELGHIYDQARVKAQSTLFLIRPLLEEKFSLVIPEGTSLNAVCRATSRREIPPAGIDIVAQFASHSAGCQLERLYDQLGLYRQGAGNAIREPSVAAAVRFLMLNEALALCLAGIAKVAGNGETYVISRLDSTASDILRATWFARSAEQGSQLGTVAAIKRFASAGVTTIDQLEPLILQVLDRDLSIPWVRLPASALALKSVEQIREAVSLVVVLTVAFARGEPVPVTRSGLQKFGLDFSAVARLLHRQSKALATDQFIIREGDALTVRIGAVSKGLRTYYRSLEEEFGERDLLREKVGGIFFEKGYIKHRLETGYEYKSRYRIFDGFHRYDVTGSAPEAIECDIEFIIRDDVFRHYYYIQAKHSLLGEKAFFESMVEAVQNDLGYGVAQLRGAKYLFESGLLNTLLTARGIADATSQNSSFVLLHNIAQFDFHSTGDGISLYDWASFRNLLLDAESVYGQMNGAQRLFKLEPPLLLDHPMKVIQRILAEHPVYKGLGANPWAAELVTTEYEIEGKQIRIEGLGI